MLYHFLQGYTDAIYIAVHLRVPKEPRHGLFPAPPVPIEAQVATGFERLFGGASWLIRAAARLPRWLRPNAADSTGRSALFGMGLTVLRRIGSRKRLRQSTR
jgi:hypothetical protein